MLTGSLMGSSRRLFASGIGCGMVLCLLIASANAVEESSSQKQADKNSQNSRKKITIDLEKKVPKDNKLATPENKPVEKVAPSANIKPVATPEKSASAPPSLPLPEGKSPTFEDLKDPFEAEVKNLPELQDPFEQYNRSMYRFNDALVEYILSPAAKGYGMIVPDAGRIALRNVFSNAASPVSIFSSIAQGDVEKSATVLGRLLLNTTLGLGGIFDVADEFYGIKPISEDFDHALGSYGVPTGPYLVLPVFGPSTMRHAFGRILDTMANPTTYFAPFAVNVSAGAGDKVNAFSFDPDLKRDLDQSAVDPYESMRYFYYQRRGAAVEK